MTIECTREECWCRNPTLPKVNSLWIRKDDRNLVRKIVIMDDHQTLKGISFNNNYDDTQIIYHTIASIGVNIMFLKSFIEKYEPLRIDDV